MLTWSESIITHPAHLDSHISLYSRFPLNERSSSTSLTANHCSGVHIYSKLRSLPHKVNNHVHYTEPCRLIRFVLVTIFQAHSFVWLQGSCHLFPAAYTHIPNLVPVLCQLLISTLSGSSCSHRYELSGRCQYNGGWHGCWDHWLM